MKTVCTAVTVTVVGIFFMRPGCSSHNPISVIWWWSSGFPYQVLIWGSPGSTHPVAGLFFLSPCCSRFMGGLAVWSGGGCFPFIHGSRAAEEPLLFIQPWHLGSSRTTGMNQWMPGRSRGARPCKRGEEDAGGGGAA